jgi:hypothetical protein
VFSLPVYVVSVLIILHVDEYISKRNKKYDKSKYTKTSEKKQHILHMGPQATMYLYTVQCKRTEFLPQSACSLASSFSAFSK